MHKPKFKLKIIIILEFRIVFTVASFVGNPVYYNLWGILKDKWHFFKELYTCPIHNDILNLYLSKNEQVTFIDR